VIVWTVILFFALSVSLTPFVFVKRRVSHVVHFLGWCGYLAACLAWYVSAHISLGKGSSATHHDFLTTEDKLKLVRDGEAALELSPVEEIPKGTSSDHISFAVPRKQFLDIPFTTIEGLEARHLSLDVYSPGIDEKHPIVVWSHGGGFVSGDKAHPLLSVVKSDFFLSRGFVFVSVNYRLAPEHKFPAQAEDTAAGAQKGVSIKKVSGTEYAKTEETVPGTFCLLQSTMLPNDVRNSKNGECS